MMPFEKTVYMFTFGCCLSQRTLAVRLFLGHQHIKSLKHILKSVITCFEVWNLALSFRR